MSYVLAGYGITAVAIVGYAGWVLRKGRSLERKP